MQLIAAGIVLYNPDSIERTRECIKTALSQIEKVYIFDNSTTRVDYVLDPSITYLSEKENKGMAYALNRIMEAAKKDGFQWVITMDQDSILPAGLINSYQDAIEKNDKLKNKLAIVCPQVIDSRRSYMLPKADPAQEYVKECITSASCTSIRAWEKIGGFDERLFIDLVDNEFCKRLIVSGYQILRLNKLILNQEFGRIIPKSKRVQRFWIHVAKILHNQNFAKFSYKKYVNPIRVYYTNRNIIYVNRKMKLYGRTAYANYNCKGYVGFIISFCIPSVLRAQNKIEALKAAIKGIKDGRAMRVDEWKIR